MKFRARLFLAFAVTGILASAQQRAPKPPKTPRLYVFDCGTLDSKDPADFDRFRLKREEVVTEKMSVGCYLVVHPKGTLMWDAGAVPDSAFKPGAASAMERYATEATPLKTQLAAAGYAPGDIAYLAMSHFHWDHIANADQFAGATWLVRQIERDAMFAEPPSPRTNPAYFQKLRNSKTVIVKDDDYDVFGDGTVVLKFTPGHTLGHQALFVKLAKSGPVLISGDLYHYPEERSLNRIPNFDMDEKQTATSRAAVEAFLKKTHAQLWIQHDITAFTKLKKAPGYYE